MAFDLKDETEVKDYIEKLGVEYRFGCYSEKNPEGTAGQLLFNRKTCSPDFVISFPVCHLLGDYLEGVKKDFEKASKVYRSTCDDYGYSKSCLKYGKYAILGKGGNGQDGDPAKVELFTRTYLLCN